MTENNSLKISKKKICIVKRDFLPYFTMLNSVVSFSNSIGYLIHANRDFDYSYYYYNFCGGMSREQVANKFEEDLQNALYDPATIDPVVVNWINEQLNYDFPVILASFQLEYYNTII